MRTLSFNKTRIRHGRQFLPTARAVDLWREVVAPERLEYYATPERCREIEARQPESESRGRALFYRPGTVTGTVKERTGKSHPIEEEPEIVVPDWRKTFEFTGDEGALADEIDAADCGEVAEELRIEVAA